MSKSLTNRLRDLVKLLGDLHGLHQELLQAVRGKTDAMRRGEIVRIQQCADIERSLVVRIQEREGLRSQLMELIGNDLGLSARSARVISASQLAKRVDEPYRERITEAAGDLKSTMAQLARENRVAGLIARDVLGHLRGIFESIGASVRRPVGYGADGALVAGADRQIIEAVG